MYLYKPPVVALVAASQVFVADVPDIWMKMLKKDHSFLIHVILIGIPQNARWRCLQKWEFEPTTESIERNRQALHPSLIVT